MRKSVCVLLIWVLGQGTGTSVMSESIQEACKDKGCEGQRSLSGDQ